MSHLVYTCLIHKLFSLYGDMYSCTLKFFLNFFILNLVWFV